MNCPTTRVKVKVTEDNPHGFVVVNTEDFDPATMTDLDAVPGVVQTPPEPTSLLAEPEPATAGAATAPWAK